MSDPFRFVPRKKSAGAYFNSGEGFEFSCQKQKGVPVDEKMKEAVRRSFLEFWRVLHGEEFPAAAKEGE